MLGQVASNKYFILAQLSFSHITNYRDISYENIYVVSKSTEGVGGWGGDVCIAS